MIDSWLLKNEWWIRKNLKKVIVHLFKLLYTGLEYHIDSSANQSNYTVGDNHPVPWKKIKPPATVFSLFADKKLNGYHRSNSNASNLLSRY